MKKFDFSKEFGNIDPKYISEAEGEWKGKKRVWTPSFWSKLAAACVILALISTVLSNPKVQAAIKNLALSIGETLGFQKEIESYTEVLNMSQTDEFWCYTESCLFFLHLSPYGNAVDQLWFLP